MCSPKKTILISNQHLDEQSEQKLDVITFRQAEFRLLLDIAELNVNTHFCCFLMDLVEKQKGDAGQNEVRHSKRCSETFLADILLYKL